MKKLLYTFFLFVTPLFGSVCSTREVLASHCDHNVDVLKTYDTITHHWSSFQQSKNEPWEMEMLLQAVEYAAIKHEGQYRKNAEKTPYIVHPLGVSQLLWEIGDIRSVNVLTTALLHDTLEDTNATAEEIRTLFGPRVLYSVQEVTNDSSISGLENKQRQIDHAPTMSLDAQLVKLADRLYNVRDLENPPPAWSQEKIQDYYGWGAKMLTALSGSNAGLENALDKQIQTHR